MHKNISNQKLHTVVAFILSAYWMQQLRKMVPQHAHQPIARAGSKSN